VRAEVRAFPDGYTAQIGKNGDGLPCFASTDKLGAFISAINNHDQYGENEAMAGAVTLRRGEHVRAIEHSGFMYANVRIRIESGNDAGAACWEPSDMDGLFVNIRAPG